MSDELVVLCYTEEECERTIDLEREIVCEKDVDRRREIMGELEMLWDLALEGGSELKKVEVISFHFCNLNHTFLFCRVHLVVYRNPFQTIHQTYHHSSRFSQRLFLFRSLFPETFFFSSCFFL